MNIAMLFLVVGGLVSYPQRMPGPELQQNGGFEQGLDGWSANGFTVDAVTYHSSGKAARIDNPDQIPYSQSITQLHSTVTSPGYYRVSLWVKTDQLGGGSKGIRCGLKAKEGPGESYCSRGCEYSQVYSGTLDWFQIQKQGIYLPDPAYGIEIRCDLYAEPSGTAWIDDVVFQEEVQTPIDADLRQPNYRGILWDDQPNEALFKITQRQAGQLWAQVCPSCQMLTPTVTPAGLHKLDLSGAPDTELTVTWYVNQTSAYPPFQLVRRPASGRSAATVAFSPTGGRFLVRGVPTFLRGVYDSGMGYPSSEQGWEETTFGQYRRLWELQGLNFYLNYWYGSMPSANAAQMMNVLQNHGVLYWQTSNCFSTGSQFGQFPSDTDSSYVFALGSHPGLGGWYLADECVASLAEVTHGRHRFRAEHDWDGVNLGVFNYQGLGPWLPSVDVLGTDEYPMYGSEPAGGYPFGKVYDSAAATATLLGPDRPFWQVIQYFQFTSLGRWPTTEELRNMTYAAVVAGAQGIVYWSIGANALAYVCPPPYSSVEWCDLKIQLYERLKTVMAELTADESILLLPSQPEKLVAVSSPNIKTLVKDGYVIAYNHSSQPVVGATFTWEAPLSGEVTVLHEGRTIATAGADWSDSFVAWESHRYELPTGGPPPPPCPDEVTITLDGKTCTCTLQ